jgi:hypothetical protein
MIDLDKKAAAKDSNSVNSMLSSITINDNLNQSLAKSSQSDEIKSQNDSN